MSLERSAVQNWTFDPRGHPVYNNRVYRNEPDCRIEFDMPSGIKQSTFEKVLGTLMCKIHKKHDTRLTVEYHSSLIRPLSVTVIGDDKWEMLECAMVLFEWGKERLRNRGIQNKEQLRVLTEMPQKDAVYIGTISLDGHWRWTPFK